MDFSRLVAANLTTAPPCPNIDVDLACLIYTSGSTGEPKGVMSTHANMIFAASSIITYLENTADDVVINVLPLSFDYGLYQLLMVFKFGGTLVLEKGFAFPAAVLKTIEREKVTGLPGVPTMFCDAAADGPEQVRPFVPALPDQHGRRPAGGTHPAVAECFPLGQDVLDVWAHRVQADPLPAARGAGSPAGLGGHSHPGHRGLDRGRTRQSAWPRRGGRAGDPRLARDAGLLEQPGSDRAAGTGRGATRPSGCCTPATCSKGTRTAFCTLSAGRTASSRAAAKKWRPKRWNRCFTNCRA